jgi:hypothetical protein
VALCLQNNVGRFRARFRLSGVAQIDPQRFQNMLQGNQNDFLLRGNLQ